MGQSGGGVRTLQLPPPFSTSLLSNWKPWLCLRSCAKGWEVHIAALCKSSLLLPGVGPVSLDSRLLWVQGWRSGFCACAFWGFLFCFVFPEGHGNNFAFVNSSPGPARHLRNDSLEVRGRQSPNYFMWIEQVPVWRHALEDGQEEAGSTFSLPTTAAFLT